MARAYADITVSDLSAATGISVRSIQRWEGGTDTPTPEHVAAVAQACGVPGWLAAGRTAELVSIVNAGEPQ